MQFTKKNQRSCGGRGFFESQQKTKQIRKFADNIAERRKCEPRRNARGDAASVSATTGVRFVEKFNKFLEYRRRNLPSTEKP